jgi:hypothetical protein
LCDRLLDIVFPNTSIAIGGITVLHLTEITCILESYGAKQFRYVEKSIQPARGCGWDLMAVFVNLTTVTCFRHVVGALLIVDLSKEFIFHEIT